MTRPIATRSDYEVTQVTPTRCHVLFKPTGRQIHVGDTMDNTSARIQIDYDLANRNDSRQSFWYVKDGKWVR